MKEFEKDSLNFKEKLKNILLRIKNSSENKRFTKKKHLIIQKMKKKWVWVWASYTQKYWNSVWVLGFIPNFCVFWVWILGVGMKPIPKTQT